MVWRPRSPWWGLLETIDGGGSSLFGVLEGDHGWRYSEGPVVERARLIAVDGAPIRPLPWGAAAPRSAFLSDGIAMADLGLGPEGLLATDPQDLP